MWEVSGFQSVKKAFELAIENGQLSHAYIFSGQEMIGKRMFALELASKINGHTNPLDCYTLVCGSGETSVAIKQVRSAKQFLSLSPAEGPYKFLMVDDADKLTVEAQNALLKILEEPNKSSIIILVTAYPTALLPTIFSRCQEIYFPSHSREEIKQALTAEGVDTAKAEFLSKFVNGRLGLAFNIVRNNLYKEVKTAIEELADLKKKPIYERIKLAATWSEDGELEQFKRKLLYWTLFLHMDFKKQQSAMLSKFFSIDQLIHQPQFNRRLMLENFLIHL